MPERLDCVRETSIVQTVCSGAELSAREEEHVRSCLSCQQALLLVDELSELALRERNERELVAPHQIWLKAQLIEGMERDHHLASRAARPLKIMAGLLVLGLLIASLDWLKSAPFMGTEGATMLLPLLFAALGLPVLSACILACFVPSG